MIRTIVVTLALLLGLAAPARAEITPEQQAVLNGVETYLNGITTLRARFIQTGNDGKQAMGTFYLKRPGRMRIDYDAPVTDFIVADGTLVYFYDGGLKQQSSAPISRSLADFFLRPTLTLGGDITVTDLMRDKEEGLKVTLVQSRNALAGSLTLVFNENPLQLKKWIVVDAQGMVTDVALVNMETGIDLKNKLFRYADPARKEFFLNQR